MLRTLHLPGIVVCTALSLAACDSGEKERAKEQDIQHQADLRVAEVQKQAKDQIAAADKKIDELTHELADAGAHARTEIQEELTKAKEDADRLATEAAAALAKARSAYKESANRQYGEILHDTEELHQKAVKAQPKVKAQIDKTVKDVSAKRADVKKAIDAFDNATLDTLNSTRAKVEQRLHELRQMVHAARAKLGA